MSKNMLQDMVKRPTREKIIDNRIIKKKNPNIINSDFELIKVREKKPKKIGLYIIAFVSIIFLFFAITFAFSKTKITITPKIKENQLKENLTAKKDSSGSDLSFDLTVLSGEEVKVIQGGEIKEVSVNATGRINIYNSYDPQAVNLKLGARLEGSNGKIYKLSNKVTVPAFKNGKPGSVQVDIVAEGVGEEYNTTPIDFKFVNFKGTAKYTKIYGRSIGDISGGFVGKTSVISSLDKLNAVSSMKESLESKLLKKITSQIPNGFILFKDAVFLEAKDSDITFSPNKDATVSIKLKGTLYGFLFDEKKLAQKIAVDTVDKYDGEEIYISNIKDMVFSLIDKDNVSFADTNSINFSLTGMPKIIWKVDKDAFVQEILNKKKSEFNQILAKFKSIDTAELILRPFWKTYFPDQVKKIEIVINYPE